MSEGVNKEVLAELRQMSSYLREIASFHRRAELASLLKDPGRRRAYELTNGARTRDDIAADKGISKSGRTISNWWSEWVDHGMLIGTMAGR